MCKKYIKLFNCKIILNAFNYIVLFIIKVFVANPNKPLPILYILQKNKEKLLTYLQNFHNDRSGI